MRCEKYQKYEFGEIEESIFQNHLKTCSECQQQVTKDEKLLSLSKSLKQPVTAPQLWDKIENSLHSQQTRSKSKFQYLKIAAVLIVAIGLSIIFMNRNKVEEIKLLADSALQKVEAKEKEYEDAIEELEKIALPKLSDMNLELMFLYKDRLETINTQIAQCKEALNENPANAHIRHYLQLALQDKTDTLREVLTYKNES